MSNIVINDLPVNNTLDTQALASIVGGMYYDDKKYSGYGWYGYPVNVLAVNAYENIFAQKTQFAFSNEVFAKQTDFNLLQITK